MDGGKGDRRHCHFSEMWQFYKVDFHGKLVAVKVAVTGHPLKLPSLSKLARLSYFPPANQAGRLAGAVFYTISFLCLCDSSSSMESLI
jgi:hypothetical protein